jgi:hypothetical protein
VPHDPHTAQRVGAIVREELALFWEDLGQRFQKLGAGFRSALEAVVGDVADLEAANTDRLSRPPHLRA